MSQTFAALFVGMLILAGAKCLIMQKGVAMKDTITKTAGYALLANSKDRKLVLTFAFVVAMIGTAVIAFVVLH